MKRFLLPAILLTAVAARAGASETGTLDASPALFTVMAALNASGFDADLASLNNHPLRDAVRQELAKRNIPSLVPIKEFVAAHRRRTDLEEASQYISFALAVKGPPDFGFKYRDVEVPPEAAALKELAPLLTAFYREAGIEDLWNRSQSAIENYIERYHEPVARAVLEANAYLRYQTSGVTGSRFQIYVELLAPPNQVQTRSYGSDYYVVVTPSPEPRIDDIRHAYMFYLLDPLATRNSEILVRKRGIADHAQRAPALPDSYKEDFLLLTTASLVKAVEARLARQPKMIDQALLEGYVLAPYFAEQLQVYEKQEQAMRLYYAEMVRAIDLRREEARLSKVEFASAAKVRTVKAPPPPEPPALTGAAKTLADAEHDMYEAHDLDKAREGFLKSVQETDDKTLHARAYYGLARIAALKNDPEVAEQLFRKTLECTPGPEVKAWTFVYLGRLARLAGEDDRAVQYFQNALGVAGAPDLARDAAQKGIGPNKKN